MKKWQLLPTKKKKLVPQQSNIPSTGTSPVTPTPITQKTDQPTTIEVEPINPSDVEKPANETDKSGISNPSKETKKVFSSGLKNKSILDTPSLDVDSLLNKITAENEKKQANRKAVTIEHIDIIWNEYINNTHSEAIKACLNMAKYELDGDSLTVYTPNNISKSDILAQKKLLTRMREDFLIPSFAMNIIVDNSKFPEVAVSKKKKVLSNKEKYENIHAQNPNIETFIKKFDLKIRND